jgi:hypothetical protein
VTQIVLPSVMVRRGSRSCLERLDYVTGIFQVRNLAKLHSMKADYRTDMRIE